MLNSFQKIAAAFFAFTLVIAYGLAEMRYDSREQRLTEKLALEQALHHSSDRLMVECAKPNTKPQDKFDIAQRLCDQGQAAHDQSQLKLLQLGEEQTRNDRNWWVTFILLIIGLNGIGYLAFRMHALLNKEVG